MIFFSKYDRNTPLGLKEFYHFLKIILICVLGGWGTQNFRTDFENSVIRPVFPQVKSPLNKNPRKSLSLIWKLIQFYLQRIMNNFLTRSHLTVIGIKLTWSLPLTVAKVILHLSHFQMWGRFFKAETFLWANRWKLSCFNLTNFFPHFSHDKMSSLGFEFCGCCCCCCWSCCCCCKDGRDVCSAPQSWIPY